MKKNIGRLSTVRESKVAQMELVKQERFAGLDVDFYKDENNNIYMTRNQIGAALEYANPNDAIRLIHNRNKFLKDEEFSVTCKLKAADGKLYRTRLLNKKGIKAIISIAERPIAIKQKVARAIESDWSFFDYLTHRVEDENIHLIQTALKAFNPEREVIIGGYRCDLLFPEKKLVVECDEYNHEHYNKELEVKREDFIKEQGYRLFRFNPHEQGFYIGNVLGEILKIILEGKQ